MIGRREFIKLLGGATAAWPLAARAQQPTMPVIGFLNGSSPGEYAPMVAAFRRGLKEAGYVEGQNLAIEQRWAEYDYDRLPAMAADLAQRPVAVIAALGGVNSALAAKAATSTIPIVFVSGGDPVTFGLVSSLKRPGGNATGISVLTIELLAKRLELLREIIPTVTVIGLLVNPANAGVAAQIRGSEEAARSLGLNLHVVNASNEQQIDTALATLVRLQASAVMVTTDPFFNGRSVQLATLLARYRFPAISEVREFAVAGGLMSYATNFADAYRQAGLYVGRVLKGDKPADLPVQQAVKLDLVINLKTAEALGLTVPPTLLARADEVIE
jgi:putative tryptophan/tyrosine transport system substrate-binding protein